MCKQCHERSVRELGPRAEDEDRIKVHDADIKEAIIEGFSAADMLMVAYDTLEENPEDPNARNLFIALSMIHYRTHPVHVYQDLRKSREDVLDVVFKDVN